MTPGLGSTRQGDGTRLAGQVASSKPSIFHQWIEKQLCNKLSAWRGIDDPFHQNSRAKRDRPAFLTLRDCVKQIVFLETRSRSGLNHWRISISQSIAGLLPLFKE